MMDDRSGDDNDDDINQLMQYLMFWPLSATIIIIRIRYNIVVIGTCWEALSEWVMMMRRI